MSALVELVRARAETLRLVEDLDAEALTRQFHPDFSPIGWHFGHVAWQEEVWLARHWAKCAPRAPELDDLFDSFVSAKGGRGKRLPGRNQLFDYVRRVRESCFQCLERAEGEPEADALMRFVANHERQHAEIIVTVRLLGELYLTAPPDSVRDDSRPTNRAPSETPSPVSSSGDPVSITGGSFVLGCDDDPDGWDNERSAHTVHVDDFRLARHPVTAGEWLSFIEARGYETRTLWTPEGWRFVRDSRIDAPLHWFRTKDGFETRTLFGVESLDPTRPVAHVSHYEAEAFARFASARLPTEAEWEYAASFAGQRKARYPWGDDRPEGRADLELRGGAPAPVGRHPAGSAPCGVEDLCGGVWEWLSTPFAPYPGFRPQAYEGYSAPWFDERHRVARGGSFATHAANARSTFRNWYERPIRQPCLGVRLAWNA